MRDLKKLKREKSMGGRIKKTFAEDAGGLRTGRVQSAVRMAKNNQSTASDTSATRGGGKECASMFEEPSDGTEKVIARRRQGGRTLKDMINAIQTKETNKKIEMAAEGINEEKESSSGSDSNPSADELDVSVIVT